MKDTFLEPSAKVAYDFVGKGIDISNWELNEVPSSKRMVNATSSNVTVTPLRKFTDNHVMSRSFTSFLSSYAASIGFSGSYKGFSGSIKAKFSASDFQSVDVQFVEFSKTIAGHIHNLGQVPSELRKYFTDDFKNQIDTADTSVLFDTYGTHLVTKATVGATIRYYCSSKVTETLSKSEFSTDAEASYDGVLYKVGATASYSEKQKEEATHILSNNHLEVRGGATSEAGAVQGGKEDSYDKWLKTVDANPAFLSFGENGLIPIWELASDSERKSIIKQAFLMRMALSPSIVTMSKTSAVENHPVVEVSLSDLDGGNTNYKLLSGGAKANSTGIGNLLTASYPPTNSSWEARGKDHDIVDPAPITVYLTALYDPYDIWETTINSKKSTSASHPQITVPLDQGEGWVVVGGGALVNYEGYGNLLTASCPLLDKDDTTPAGWQAASKDHIHPDPATVEAFVIGLKCKLDELSIATKVSAVTSIPAAHPKQDASVHQGMLLVGGGAKDNWEGDGNMLTASYPLDVDTWQGCGKDQVVPSPAKLTAYAIGLSVTA